MREYYAIFRWNELPGDEVPYLEKIFVAIVYATEDEIAEFLEKWDNSDNYDVELGDRGISAEKCKLANFNSFNPYE